MRVQFYALSVFGVAMWCLIFMRLQGGFVDMRENVATMVKSMRGVRKNTSTVGTTSSKNETLTVKTNIVIVIPYRDREVHYKKIMKHLPIITRTNWNITTIVVEQADDAHFRRAWLLNIGIAEARKRFTDDETCVVTHDVDMLANSDVDYAWCDKPTQICSELSCFNGGVPYVTSGGGVVQATLRDWYTINGFTNKAFGWGGEDDDLHHRFRQNHMLTQGHLRRPKKGFGKCHCMNDRHHTKRAKHSVEYNNIVKQIGRLSRGSKEWKSDGLSSLQYNVVESSVDSFGTHWFKVNDKKQKNIYLVQGEANLYQIWKSRISNIDAVLLYLSYDNDCEGCIFEPSTNYVSGVNKLVRRAMSIPNSNFIVYMDADIDMECKLFNENAIIHDNCWEKWNSFLLDQDSEYLISPKTWKDPKGEASTHGTCVESGTIALRRDKIHLIYPLPDYNVNKSWWLNVHARWHVTESCFPNEHFSVSDFRIYNKQHSSYPRGKNAKDVKEIFENDYIGLNLAENYQHRDHRCQIKTVHKMQCDSKLKERFDLWMKHEEKQRDFLLFTSAGDKSSIARWLSKDRTYDVVVVYYGDKTFDYAVDEIYYHKDTKFPNLKWYMQNHTIDMYKAIAVWDDDIQASSKQIDFLFKQMLQSKANIFSPCHTRGNFASLFKFKSSGWRHVDFVEMNAPMFVHDELIDFMSVFDPVIKGWGTDTWYSHRCNERNDCSIVVSDSVCVTNPETRADGTREIEKAQPEPIRAKVWGNYAKNVLHINKNVPTTVTRKGYDKPSLTNPNVQK